MAWRIHDNVKRGEIDNRERGIVRGRLWLDGCAAPLVLQLAGNACADLAGCLLTFENPGHTLPMRPDVMMNTLQCGTIGDLTASRKVRVLDLPLEDALDRFEKKLQVPEHWANSLYLEWFSEANGRVVVESAEYRLKISPPAWHLSPEEEQQRQLEAQAGFTGFVGRLSQALEDARHEPPEDKEWDEFDFEKLMRESDARTDKHLELLDKYRDHPNREAIIAKEMGWSDEESSSDDEMSVAGQRAEASSEDDQENGGVAGEDGPFDVDEINRICAETFENPPEPDPLTEGIDWVKDEEGDICHPLYRRSFDSSLRLWKQCEALGPERGGDDDLVELVSEIQMTTAKLAGALNSLGYGRDISEGAFIVARLKRGLNHLHAAQSALEKVAPKQLLSGKLLAEMRAELFEIREEVLRLMEEFRGCK